MIRYKTFDSTGIATAGRLYASDLNAIQDAAAGLTDFTQNISAGSVIFGEVGLTISKYGTAEAQLAGSFRTTGRMLASGGLIPGSFTTTTRNAIAAGGAPTGIIIYNTTTAQFEWNSGSDGARVWKALSYDPAGDLTLTGGGSSADFTDQTASNVFLSAKRTGDSVTRIAIREDGLVEWGPGGATAKDTNLFRSAADILKTDDAFIVAGAKGVMQTGNYGTAFPGSPSDGQEFTLVDSITNPTYSWRFRYNSGSANTDKWEFIGGAQGVSEIVTQENFTGGGGVHDLATTGPIFTVPRAGVYVFNWGMHCTPQTGGSFNSSCSADLWNAASAALTTVICAVASQGSVDSISTKARVAGLAASTAVRVRYTNSIGGGSPGWAKFRFLEVIPVRCS